jgi:hypothetical protein
MDFRNKTVFVISIAFGLTLSILSYAAEPLSFQAISTINRPALQSALKRNNNADLLKNSSISMADLNGDGIDEIIARPSACKDKKSLCSYSIYGQFEDKLVSLGTITAHRLELSNHEKYGIREIIAYDSVKNFYSYSLYSWQPEKSQFIQFAQENN